MVTAAYFVYTLVLLGLIGLAVGIRSERDRAYLWVMLAVLVGLVYDNLIIALGSFIGEGDFLKTLNAGRYAGHAFGTPLLTIFAFGIARRAGVGWAQGKTAHILACVFTTALIGLGVYEDIIRLDLAPRVMFDTFRYTNMAVKGPPIPPILTILMLIALGISIWRKSGWKWLALGAIFMFIAAAAGTGDRLFIGNLGETVLGVSSVFSAKKFFSPN
jgi:hypothetical protein